MLFFSVTFDWHLVFIIHKFSALQDSPFPSRLSRKTKFFLGPFFFICTHWHFLSCCLIQY